MSIRRFQVGYAAGHRSPPLGAYAARLKLYRQIKRVWDGSKPLKFRRAHGTSRTATGPWSCAVRIIRAAKERKHTSVWFINVGLKLYCHVTPAPPPFPSVPSGAYADQIEALWEEVWTVFPKVRSMGVYAPRQVSGSSFWSEHAWAEAWDIGWPLDWTDAAGVAYLHLLAAYLRANAQRLHIRHLIWRDQQSIDGGPWFPYTGQFHTAHIHVATGKHNGAKPPWTP